MLKGIRALALGGLLSCWVVGVAQGQCISIDSVDVAKTENFDTLAATESGIATPPGWAFAEIGAAANTAYVAGTGTVSTGDTYSFGTVGSSDRAFGGLRDGNVSTIIGACFVNNTDAALTAIDISYTGEQWRLGSTGPIDRIDFEYSVDATSLTSGIWTDYEELDFASRVTSGTIGAIDGNQSGNRRLTSNRLERLSIAPGATFWIRWMDFNTSGADDALAIDDFSLQPNTSGTGELPRLNVGTTGYPEGNSGLQAVPVTVSLRSPAGPGGVTFNYATSDGTATTAGSDYVAKSGSSVIPPGSTSTTLTVNVKGDTDPEASENFFIALSNVIGASIDNVIAEVIISDEDGAVPIHAIQGPGARSPLVGQVVATTGIVTGGRPAGFFIQAADSDADADPRTSEGIYVFTDTLPETGLRIGSRVNVQGTVQEYVPSADPLQPSRTQIGNRPYVTLLSYGSTLPAAVPLTTALPDRNGAFDQLERLEGMRVSANSVTVTAPTDGTVDETTAKATSNGIFHAVVTGLPLAYRLPGLQQPDLLPFGSPANVPRWNTNPQVIAVENGAGLHVEATIGCLVTGAAGPLDYLSRRYTIKSISRLSLNCPYGIWRPLPAQAPTADDVSIATFNMDRFFDDGDDAAIGEPVLTPSAYQGRLNKASLAIRNYLNTPDIIGTIEVESLSVLQAIAARVNADAVAAGQPDPKYVAYLQEGNDVDGIDVGFLVKTAGVGAGLERIEVVSVTQEGKSTTWVQPGGTSSLLNDRPPLVLKAIAHFVDGRSFPLTAIVVHQRSLDGVGTDDDDGERVRAKRQQQAVFLANLIQSRQVADPSERLLVMGTFNAFEFNDGYGDSMGTTTGIPSPDDQTVVPGDGVDLVDPDLDNLTLLNASEVSYSSAFEGNVQSLDHVLANSALLDARDLATLAISHARINAGFSESARSEFYTPVRVSRHDPIVVLIKARPLTFADLSMQGSANREIAGPGETIAFDVTMTNRGPDAAVFPGAGFAFDRELPDLDMVAPSGWACDAPVIEAGSTSVACAAASAAANRSQQFRLSTTVPQEPLRGVVTLSASASSETTDRDPDNNNAAVSVSIDAIADLAITLAGPGRLLRTSAPQELTASLVNRGPTAAPASRVTLKSDALKTYMALVPPSGWDCIVSPARRFEATCATADLLAPDAEAIFRLQVVTAGRLAPIRFTLSGAAGSAADDPDATNDRASKQFSVGGIR